MLLTSRFSWKKAWHKRLQAVTCSASILLLLVATQKPYCISLLLVVCIFGLYIFSKGLGMFDHTLLHGLERSYTV